MCLCAPREENEDACGKDQMQLGPLDGKKTRRKTHAVLQWCPQKVRQSSLPRKQKLKFTQNKKPLPGRAQPCTHSQVMATHSWQHHWQKQHVGMSQETVLVECQQPCLLTLSAVAMWRLKPVRHEAAGQPPLLMEAKEQNLAGMEFPSGVIAGAQGRFATVSEPAKGQMQTPLLASVTHWGPGEGGPWSCPEHSWTQGVTWSTSLVGVQTRSPKPGRHQHDDCVPSWFV